MTNREIHRSYFDKLSDPRWIEFRIDYINSLGGPHKVRCRYCGDKGPNLQVHHRGYQNRLDPWEYEFGDVMLLCNQCHDEVHEHADMLWNEILKLDNKWAIYEATKHVKRIAEEYIDRRKPYRGGAIDAIPITVFPPQQ